MHKVFREIVPIDILPDEIMVLILELLSLKEAARTSILSRRWRNLWHYTTRLNFDAAVVLPKSLLFRSHDWYVKWVNSVIAARAALSGLTRAEEFRIQYELKATDSCHIDKWIQFAVLNPVEKLHLRFGGWVYQNGIYHEEQYVLTQDPWLKAPTGLSCLQCLKSLVLTSVNVNKQFIEFILSSCPLLEDLWLENANACSGLDFSIAPPLRLRQLTIHRGRVNVLANLSAPRLTSLFYHSTEFNPEKIDVPMLSDLTVGDPTQSQHIMTFLVPFLSYLPQLEKLELVMHKRQKFSWKRMTLPQLAKLKYLKIDTDWDTDPISFQIGEFINACPFLETFALQIFDGTGIPNSQSTRQRRIKQKRLDKVDKSCSFESLKVLELYGGDGKTIDQVVARCIIKNAPNLEKLIVDIRVPGRVVERPWRARTMLNEAVKAKAEELCQKSHLNVEITVVG